MVPFYPDRYKRDKETLYYVEIRTVLHTYSTYYRCVGSKVPGPEPFYYIFCGSDYPVVTPPAKPDETPRPDLTVYLSPPVMSTSMSVLASFLCSRAGRRTKHGR